MRLLQPQVILRLQHEEKGDHLISGEKLLKFCLNVSLCVVLSLGSRC